jgi:hypothetical protein
MLYLSLFLLIIGGLIGSSQATNAAVLCANSRGAVFVRSECRRGETLLDPSVFGGQKPPAITLAVYDAAGTKVGDVIDAEFFRVTVAFTVEERVFVVAVLRDDWEGSAAFDDPLFESLDCSGQPFVSTSPSNGQITALPVVAVSAPGRTAYVENLDSTPQTLTLRSQLLDNGTCTGISFSASFAFPATLLIDLGALFTPPFSVR